MLPLEEAILEADLGDEALETLDLGLFKRVSHRPDPIVDTQPLVPTSARTAGVIAAFKTRIPAPQPLEEFTTSELEEGFELFGDEEELEADKE